MHKHPLFSMLVAALGVSLTGCALYTPGGYRGAGYYAASPGRLTSGEGCRYSSFSSCGYLGPYSGAFGYSHLHNGWEDGFHGHFGSSDIHNPWLSLASGFGTYGRHDNQAHYSLGVFAPLSFTNWGTGHGSRDHRTSSAVVWGGRSSGHSLSWHDASHHSDEHITSGHTRTAPRNWQAPHQAPRHRFGTGSRGRSHH